MFIVKRLDNSRDYAFVNRVSDQGWTAYCRAMGFVCQMQEDARWSTLYTVLRVVVKMEQLTGDGPVGMLVNMPRRPRRPP